MLTLKSFKYSERGNEVSLTLDTDAGEASYTLTANSFASLTRSLGYSIELMRPPLTLPDECMPQIARDAERLQCNKKGLLLLSYGPCSSRMLRDKLRRAGFSDAAADFTVGYLSDRHAIDDLGYARARALALKERKSYGRRRIEQDLYTRGIPREVIREALDSPEFADFNTELDARLRKKYTPESLRGPDLKHRAVAALMRQGFAYGEIKEALERFTSAEVDFDETEFDGADGAEEETEN